MEYLMLVHKATLGTAVLLAVAAAVVARRRSGKWLDTHRALAAAAAFLAVVGFAAVETFKFQMGYWHLVSTHAMVGLAGVVMFVVTPMLGMLKISGKLSIGRAHGYAGWLTVALAVTAGILGIAKNFAPRK